MKKGLLASYVHGIKDLNNGESYSTIFRYFLPEFVTALLLYSVPIWIEGHFISYLKSTPAFATLGATNNLIHWLIKAAEAFSVGTLVLSGQFNGRQAYPEVGRSVRDAFWLTTFIGLTIGSALYFGAYSIYYWLGVPAEIINLGVPYLQLRAISVFFMFIYMAFVGFLRGIKNTKVPMQAYVMGTVVLLIVEYLFIFGAFGFPQMGLQGAALASVVQYFCMTVAVLVYIVANQANRKYAIDLFSVVRTPRYFRELIKLSWPMLIDKVTLASAYIWLLKMVAPLGSAIVATFCVVKDMERFAFAPALAFAQIITLLVSNDYGKQQWDAIKSNIKKIVFLASMGVLIILVLFSINPEFIVSLFDKKCEFSGFAARAFPILSVLAFIDVTQVVLAGAMRGAANVRVVMMVRLLVCIGIFMPFSYAVSLMPIADPVVKLICVYATYYLSNGIMSIIYINRFRSEEWKKQVV